MEIKYKRKKIKNFSISTGYLLDQDAYLTILYYKKIEILEALFFDEEWDLEKPTEIVFHQNYDGENHSFLKFLDLLYFLRDKIRNNDYSKDFSDHEFKIFVSIIDKRVDFDVFCREKKLFRIEFKNKYFSKPKIIFFNRYYFSLKYKYNEVEYRTAIIPLDDFIEEMEDIKDEFCNCIIKNQNLKKTFF
ncbi:MAG TPA: hypothetical protein PLQ36_01355 [Candidatus Gracilibacteria bacterium]|nr:hypothetical protein [Candidatus Gracilibacteria bacterium]